MRTRINRYFTCDDSLQGIWIDIIFKFYSFHCSGSDITEILGGDDSFRDLFEDVPKPEPQEHEPPTLYQRSTFIEHYDSTTFYPPQSGIWSNLEIISL